MKKRCISLLLVLLMALTLLPTEALAMLGSSVGSLRDVIQPVTIKKEGVEDGSQLYSMRMNNGKLVMSIATSGPPYGKVGNDLRPGLYRPHGFHPQGRL